MSDSAIKKLTQQIDIQQLLKRIDYDLPGIDRAFRAIIQIEVPDWPDRLETLTEDRQQVTVSPIRKSECR